MLDIFEMQQGGSQYRRLMAALSALQSLDLFGTDTQIERALVTHQARFNFRREARIWYSRIRTKDCSLVVLRTRSFSVTNCFGR